MSAAESGFDRTETAGLVRSVARMNFDRTETGSAARKGVAAKCLTVRRFAGWTGVDFGAHRDISVEIILPKDNKEI